MAAKIPVRLAHLTPEHVALRALSKMTESTPEAILEIIVQADANIDLNEHTGKMEMLEAVKQEIEKIVAERIAPAGGVACMSDKFAKSIFPTFDINVPMPTDTAVPGSYNRPVQQLAEIRTSPVSVLKPLAEMSLGELSLELRAAKEAYKAADYQDRLIYWREARRAAQARIDAVNGEAGRRLAELEETPAQGEHVDGG